MLAQRVIEKRASRKHCSGPRAERLNPSVYARQRTMKKSFTLASCPLLAALAATRAVGEPAAAAEADAAAAAVEGLWAYTTLTPSGSEEELDLTGLFLFKDGLFAQQSI